MRCPPSRVAIALLACVLFSVPPLVEHASAGSGPDSLEARDRGAAEPDSAESPDVWLPIPEEDVEVPEALLEEGPSAGTGVLIRGGITRGRLGLRRVAIEGSPRGIRTDLGFLVEGTGGRRIRPGVRLYPGRLLLAGGRVSVSKAPPLLSEALRILRTGRRVPGPRAGAIAADPSLGASAGAMDGAVIAFRGGLAPWTFAGIRPGKRERVAGAGLGFAGRTVRVLAAAGAADPGSRAASLTIDYHQSRGRSMAAEGLASSEGRAFLAEVTSRGEGILVTARWRYRSWTTGRVAAELSARTLGRGPRARLTWRSWAEDATRDDGVLELEASGPREALFRVRLGAAGLGSGRDRAARPEAYGILDAALAHDAARSLGVHWMRRGSSSLGSSATSTTVGARLDVRDGRMGEHTILIESTRVRKGTPAWGVELTPSGTTTLRARTKPGMWITARGGFGRRPWRLGYALERGEDAEGPRPWSGTIWLRLWR